MKREARLCSWWLGRDSKREMKELEVLGMCWRTPARTRRSESSRPTVVWRVLIAREKRIGSWMYKGLGMVAGGRIAAGGGMFDGQGVLRIIVKANKQPGNPDVSRVLLT